MHTHTHWTLSWEQLDMFGVWCSSSVLYQNVCVGRERETILTILAGCFLNPLWAIGFPTMDPPGLTWLPLFFTAVEVTDWNQPGGQINLSIYDPEMWHCFLNAVVPSWFSLKGACVRARMCVCVCVWRERFLWVCISVSSCASGRDWSKMLYDRCTKLSFPPSHPL